jgi:hypothetical protein
MKLGIGAIPQNLIIKSGGFTYYPLNQFEIDGTVAVELYRQDPEGEKRKIFIFKGEKDELKKFKTKFPVIKEMRSYNEYGSGSSRKTKMVSTNTSDSYLLYKLAENLSAEAANFNKKIKTGGKLTPNELRAAGAGKKITPAQIKIIKPEWDKMKKFLAKPNAKTVATKTFTLSDYRKNENANDHSLNALRLVEKFGTEKELSEIRQIRMRHNIKGSISLEDQQKRDKIAGKYFKLLLPATKKPAVKKVAAKKVTTKKPAAVKKATTKKSPLRQTGSSNTKFDKLVQAMKPGKRTSAAGNVYYERRADHSDKGKKL